MGSDKSAQMSARFLKLRAPDIYPHHCVLAHQVGIVTITPSNVDAETYVNNQRVTETTELQHGAVVRFGRHELFRFLDPLHLEVHVHAL